MWARVTNRKHHGKVTTSKVLITSLLVDVLDFFMNIAIAIFTGSVVMLVEALQGLADLTAVSMLLFGYRSSRRKATKKHPFGYGKEVYFWSVLSAFIIVAITASLSFYFGYKEFMNPTPVENISVAYLVLGVAVVTNAYAFYVGASKLLEGTGKPLTKIGHAFMTSPMIAPKTTVVLDAMGTLAAVFGLSSLIAYGVTGDVHLDGLGAMLMAVVLAIFSVMLLISTRSLVTGQSAPPELEEKIRQAALRVPEVRNVLGLSTMMLGTESTLANIEVNIRNDHSTDEVEKIIKDVKKEVHLVQPGIRVHVEPDAH
jgi:cation diffusion facilitator family transporter